VNIIGTPAGRPTFRRRRIVSGAAFIAVSALALAGCAGPADTSAEGATKIAAQLGWVLDPSYGAFMAADDKGYWAAEDVEVELQPGGSNAIKGEQALAGGTAQIATSDDMFSIVSAINSGTDIVVLGAVYQDTLSGLVSLADDPVTSLEDFDGRTLGIDPAAADRYKKAMDKEGIDPDGFDAIATSDANALIQGEVSAIGAFKASQPVQLEALGHETHWLSAGELGFPDYNVYILTTRDYLEGNPEAVEGFLRGLEKGAETAVADPAYIADISVNNYGADLGQDADTALTQAEQFSEAMQSDYTAEHGLLSIDREQVAGPIYTALTDLYEVEEVPDVDSVLDTSILAGILDGKTSLLD
jgi:NitT/TauT family transport system substrate-binding protein